MEAFAATAVSTTAGSLPLLVVAYPAITRVDELSAGDLAGLGLLVVGSSLVGTVLWNYGLASVSGAQGALFLYLVPLIGVTGGALLLGERLTPLLLIGGTLVLVGVAWSQLRPRRPKAMRHSPL